MDKYNLQNIPNEIILAAFNRISDDYLILDDLDDEDMEEILEEFEIIISPNFNIEQIERQAEIDSEYKEKMFNLFKTLKNDFENDYSSLISIKDLKEDFEIEYEILDDYQQLRNAFVEALKYFVDELTHNGQLCSCGNFHVDGDDDAEMIIDKGFIKIIQHSKNRVEEFILYDEQKHKKLVDTMIRKLINSNKVKIDEETPQDEEKTL